MDTTNVGQSTQNENQSANNEGQVFEKFCQCYSLSILNID